MDSVLIVGTGTIGAPLAALFCALRRELDLEEVIVYKHTPRLRDRAELASLLQAGARLCVDPDRAGLFEELGFRPDILGLEAGVRRARVVVDCTPDGVGLQHKERLYLRHRGGRRFVAQGSEWGFGKPYVVGVNDGALREDDEFVQVLSCNTHAIASVVHALAGTDEGYDLEWGRFLCLRRASDVGQEVDVVPAIKVSGHRAPWGTHHARDAYHLFRTVGAELDLFSSAVQVNTQYMHVVHFHLRLRTPITAEGAAERITAHPYLAVTHKPLTNLVFSFGRDHGFCGRLLSHAVVVAPTVEVRAEREVVGFAFTPQDGNVLLSNLAAACRFLQPGLDPQRLERLKGFLPKEV
ncbi:MAG: hypothetical protein QN210_12210 [Armatimonadota bacterium]|nr:hypothetical protein [Armatimonadota bacterium]MDR7462217.1 hypothetical protein [Armatimonadota bacterium]MDR7565931.1 hypothetical protein [Armatimonadota bacterium]MDR7578428.1 hypothetical protein [Armatimonadota bacterium]MDR7595478.1 hypothetical protein [Armatimonadota bacterium]